MIKLAIVDDHQFVIDGLVKLLKYDPEIQVERFYNSGNVLIDDLKTHDFDVILMDINMPIINGFETSEKVIKQHPDQKILMFSMECTASHIAKAKEIGAFGFVSKSEEIQSLIKSIKSVNQGTYIFPVTDDVLN